MKNINMGPEIIYDFENEAPKGSMMDLLRNFVKKHENQFKIEGPFSPNENKGGSTASMLSN